MSLNEIYDNPANNSVIPWQNYRINDLNIAKNFNIDTTGASIGDVLQLNGSLDYTWVPYSQTVTQPLEYCKAVFSTSSIPTTTETIIEVSAVAGSPSFTTNILGQIVVTESCSLLLFLNMTSVPTQYSLPLFSMYKRSVTGDVALIKMCPYLTTNGIPYTSCNSIAPVQCNPGDRIEVTGFLIGNSSQSCGVITAESNLNILRLN
jgi:hypothetical protein